MIERFDGEWPADKIIRALETGYHGLRAALGRIRGYFSLPGPSDEFLDQGTGTSSNDVPKIDADSIALLSRMAAYGSNRFHTPYQ